MNTLNLKFVFSHLLFFVLIPLLVIGQPQNRTSQTQSGKAEIKLTAPDIKMALEVIKANTMSLPGFLPGSRTKMSSGKFSEADALALYLLKFHQQTKICPPIKLAAELVKKINDSELHKKAVTIFWLEYSTTSDLNEGLDKPDALQDNFEYYILTKQTERLKIQNARLQGYVGSDEAWRKAMASQEKTWQKSSARQNEYILTRETYRVILDAQAAIIAAKYAVQSAH